MRERRLSVRELADGTTYDFSRATPTPTPTLTPTSTLTPTPVPFIRISGTITNITDALPYFSDRSVLQLVRLSDDGSVTVSISEDGISLEPALAQIPIPAENGFFEFGLDNIEPGVYIISAQYFTGLPVFMMPIGHDSDHRIEIEFLDNPTEPFNLPLGDVILMLP